MLVIAILVVGELAMGFEQVEEDTHRGVEVFATLATRNRPQTLQYLHCVVGVFPGPWLPDLFGDLSAWF